MLLEGIPLLIDISSPLVRGLSMGCSAHSIGTAALISSGDPEGAAISSATMCITGAAHTLLLQLPASVGWLQSSLPRARQAVRAKKVACRTSKARKNARMQSRTRGKFV